MTGFGRGEISENDRTWIVEVKSVNHRFLDQRIMLPRSLGVLEERIRRQVAGSQERGRVEVGISVRGQQPGEMALQVDRELADQYHRCLQELRRQLHIGDEVSLTNMLAYPDIIVRQDEDPDLDHEWDMIDQALSLALQECTRMREEEGRALKRELLGRLDRFDTLVATVRAKIPEIVHRRQEQLRQRVSELLDGFDLDPMRLAQEVAIMADKSDVTEEIVRLESHISQFRLFFQYDEPVGRRLDFLLQEFLREVNTLSSKISSESVAHLGVEMKNEIEKLREQVQNIE